MTAPRCDHGREYGGMGVGCCQDCDHRALADVKRQREFDLAAYLERSRRRARLLLVAAVAAAVAVNVILHLLWR